MRRHLRLLRALQLPGLLSDLAALASAAPAAAAPAAAHTRAPAGEAGALALRRLAAAACVAGALCGAARGAAAALSGQLAHSFFMPLCLTGLAVAARVQARCIIQCGLRQVLYADFHGIRGVQVGPRLPVRPASAQLGGSISQVAACRRWQRSWRWTPRARITRWPRSSPRCPTTAARALRLVRCSPALLPRCLMLRPHCIRYAACACLAPGSAVCNTCPRADALPPLVRCEWPRGQPRLAPLPAGAPAEALPARAAAHAARRLACQCAAAGAAGRPSQGASDGGAHAGELGVRISREDAARLRASAGPGAASGGPAGPADALVGGDAVRARAGAAPPRGGGRPKAARARAGAGARGAGAPRGNPDASGGGGPARGGGATLAAVVDRRACVCEICFQARLCHDQVLPLPAAKVAGFAAAPCCS